MKTIIIIIIAIIAALAIVKLVTKNIIKVLAIIVVLIGLLLYLFVVFGSDEKIKFKDVLTEYSIDDLQNIYCKEGVSYPDSIKCKCIIKHINDDLHSRFSNSEINKLKSKRLKLAVEILKSYNNKKSIIKEDLKRNNALHLLDDFKKEIFKK